MAWSPAPLIDTVRVCAADEPVGSWAWSIIVPVLFNCVLEPHTIDDTPVAKVVVFTERAAMFAGVVTEESDAG